MSTYTKHVWQDAPDPTSPPVGAVELDAATLNEMEDGIAGAYDYRPGETVTVGKDPVSGFWPTSYQADRTPVYSGGSESAGVRPTARADVYVHWQGPDPSPAVVTSGTGGMRAGLDSRFVTP